MRQVSRFYIYVLGNCLIVCCVQLIEKVYILLNETTEPAHIVSNY